MSVTITFVLSADLPRAEEDAALAAVARLPGVRQAGRIGLRYRPRTGRRLCYAEIANDASPDRVRAALERLPGIESSLQPARQAL